MYHPAEQRNWPKQLSVDVIYFALAEMSLYIGNFLCGGRQDLAQIYWVHKYRPLKMPKPPTYIVLKITGVYKSKYYA